MRIALDGKHPDSRFPVRRIRRGGNAVLGLHSKFLFLMKPYELHAIDKHQLHSAIVIATFVKIDKAFQRFDFMGIVCSDTQLRQTRHIYLTSEGGHAVIVIGDSHIHHRILCATLIHEIGHKVKLQHITLCKE